MGWLRRLLRRPPLLHVAGDVGSGPPVVLVHGIASSSVTFENVVPLITDRHRAVSIDLLGFGESVAPEDATFTIEEHVAALRRTLRTMGLRHIVLVATRYAAGYRREISRLVIVSPPVYVTPTEIAAPFDRAAMDGYLRLYEFLRRNKEFTIRAAAGLARLSPIKNLLDVSEKNWNAFVRSLETSIESQTTVSDLVQVTAPIHLVYGTLDPLLHPAGLRIVESLRGVTAHKVQGVDHVIRPRMARVVATAIG
jgi:pimeloyl-ACP methyl ester carboxylesterase